ncbi:MAG: 50S ribosomal protein L19 [Saprospiraceae bacterium]|nr:50S ribosomal protein L19 [Saprospiraceae bacterium]MBK8451609.1 50S ribosomal protein L19 [Saprospiraceae bacterium]MBK8486041.1 50S ribosomal protein L19 [Saprospiraceae bacterium]MBK9221084.1 50S ribosomal protein L19 [Saprospiraceae bacterium]MBK9722064.1 50S ribosomal protein L19 [Saprospiraceae bacterium]
MELIKYVQDQLMDISRIPEFSSGDTIVISYKIIEGNKERIQDFRGDVINIRGEGKNKTFTVRKVSSGIGVERIFPFSSPNISEIKVVKKGRVRRAKLFYLRQLSGKKARIKEKTMAVREETAK